MKRELLLRFPVHHCTRTGKWFASVLLAGAAIFGQTSGLGPPYMSNVPDVQVMMPDKKVRDVRPSVVTIQELSHVVPKRARKEMEKGEVARFKNRVDEAIDHMRKAISFDPSFVAARNNLAVLYFLKKQPEAAIEQLEQAVSVDPHNRVLFRNLTLAYIFSRRLEEAERSARAAVNLDWAGAHPRLLLGLVLVQRRKFSEEALQCLDRARASYPVANLFAATVFVAQGNIENAKSYLQTCLSSGDGELRARATNWLASIAKSQRLGVQLSLR